MILVFSCGPQKKYIKYAVKKGETIRTIAKKYDMKTIDLLKLNPEVSRRPAPYTLIRIPDKKYAKFRSVSKSTHTHIVSPKETIYSISKKYLVSIDALNKANPTIKKGLKIGKRFKNWNGVDDSQKRYENC